MCIVFWTHRGLKSSYRFILAANRDEFYKRPTLPAQFLQQHPHILAGVDIKPGVVGGTWLGLSRTGRIAVLTNYRRPIDQQDLDVKRRGRLCIDYLSGSLQPDEYLFNLSQHGSDYQGFSIVVGDLSKNLSDSSDSRFYCYSNMDDFGLKKLDTGTYGLCNEVLNTPWPKLTHGKLAFDKIVAKIDSGLTKDSSIQELLGLMNNSDRYPDDMLPATGLPLQFERQLSSIFVKDDLSIGFGTVSTAIILVDHEDNVTYVERFMDRSTGQWSEKRFDFPLEQ